MKKILIFLLSLCIVMSVPATNLVGIFVTSREQEAADTDKGLALLDKYDSYDTAEAEKKINRGNRKKSLRYGGTPAEIESVLKKLENGKTTYKKIFSDVCIAGDSLMNGLEVYYVLNSNKLVTRVSATLKHLSDNSKKIIQMNPPVLILHYGINHISVDKQQKESFISSYKKIISSLKKKLPETRIIVSGIFPVDTSRATDEKFGKIEEYNRALTVMCKELEIEFLNSAPTLKAHPECYGADGIHLSKTFYERYWLKYIVEKKGIVG